MLNSAEHETCPVNKLLTIANYFLLNIAEHENVSANKYENANIIISREIVMLIHIYLLTKKFSCSAELSKKKVL